ncbi:hypothetical protein ABT167_27460 [Streptomyces sp. NPDC001792]|uniref:hypothetical protein n=1 Tax=Streptomyces sp. NPDC001792 TaxID=3154524 RepID=UPI0033180920
MSDLTPLAKAEAAVREAAENTDVARIVAAVLATQQATQQQPTSVVQSPTQTFDAKKWVVIGGVVVSVGLVGALFAVAIAIGAVSVGILALVLRSLYRDFQRGK